MRAWFGRVAAMAALVLTGAPVSAHETLHEVHRNKAIAVKVFFADGEILTDTQYEIHSPADPKISYQKGLTDPEGWVAFVPNTTGKWHLKVIDNTGHGHDLEIDAATNEDGVNAASSPTFVLRPIVGLLVIGTVFSALFLVYRRKKATP